jgi:hypothetical protein
VLCRRAANSGRASGASWISRLLREQAEHALDVGQRLADLAVEHAEVVERHVELDQEGIHQHDVAHRHAAVGDAHRRAPHHQRHAGGDDQRLAQVEPGQRDLAADLRRFPLLHLLVVAVVFPALVVEVLHRLEVDQAIHGAHVGCRVQFVHLAPQHRAPVGDEDGEHHVDDQRRPP